MEMMLDVAAGVIIAGLVLGAIGAGMKVLGWAFETEENPEFPKPNGLHLLAAILLVIGVGTAIWLVFVRTGILF